MLQMRDLYCVLGFDLLGPGNPHNRPENLADPDHILLPADTAAAVWGVGMVVALGTQLVNLVGPCMQALHYGAGRQITPQSGAVTTFGFGRYDTWVYATGCHGALSQ